MPHSNHMENGRNVCWRRASVKKVPPVIVFLHCRKEAFPEPTGDNGEKLIIILLTTFTSNTSSAAILNLH